MLPKIHEPWKPSEILQKHSVGNAQIQVSISDEPMT